MQQLYPRFFLIWAYNSVSKCPPGGPGRGPGARFRRRCAGVRRRLDEIIAKHTDQPLDKVAQDTERDYFMSAEEAVEYKLVDRVIDQR